MMDSSAGHGVRRRDLAGDELLAARVCLPTGHVQRRDREEGEVAWGFCAVEEWMGMPSWSSSHRGEQQSSTGKQLLACLLHVREQLA